MIRVIRDPMSFLPYMLQVSAVLAGVTTGAAAFAQDGELATATDCIAAQQLIGGYEAGALRAVTDVAAYDNLGDYLQSKAAIKNGRISLHSFVPSAVQGGSEYPQLWCKLKSASDIGATRDLALPVATAAVNCDGVNAAFLSAALAANPELQAQYDRVGFTFEFKNITLRAGNQWAPSVPKIKYEGGKRLIIETTSLESPRGIPVVGGMNYCKLFDASAFKPLLTDLERGDFDRVLIERRDINTSAAIAGPGLRTALVSYSPLDGTGTPSGAKKAADLYWPDATTTLKGTYIISPGGGVKPLQMRALAKGFAASGYTVFVVHYPFDLAVADKNAATELGQVVRAGKWASINGLPADLAQRYEQAGGPLPLRVFGHSLGGAALGEAIFGDASPFDNVVLYGTTSFLSGGKTIKTAALTALFGSNDGLSIRKATSIDDFRKDLGITNQVSDGRFQAAAGQPYFVQTINGLNHFCIISDLTAGDAKLRGQDRDGAVPSSCIATVLKVLAEDELL